MCRIYQFACGECVGFVSLLMVSGICQFACGEYVGFVSLLVVSG